MCMQGITSERSLKEGNYSILFVWMGQRANSLDRTSSISFLEACLFRQPTYNLQSCFPKPPAMKKVVTSAIKGIQQQESS